MKDACQANLTSILFVIFLIISISVADELPKKNKEISITVQEMQRANYFTFAMLINMVQERIPSNTTFLMPRDQMLSNITIPESHVLSFILRHSIPSVLLFDDLKHLPTGTIVPTYQRDYKLRIINGGRMRYYLNSVQIVSINICTSGSSFRCHGISGVLSTETQERNQSMCHQSNPPAPTETSPAPLRGQLPPPCVVGFCSVVPIPSPPPGDSSDESRASISSHLGFGVLLVTISSCMMLSIM